MVLVVSRIVISSCPSIATVSVISSALHRALPPPTPLAVKERSLISTLPATIFNHHYSRIYCARSAPLKGGLTGSIVTAHRPTIALALTPISPREKAGSAQLEVGLNRSVSLSAANPSNAVESRVQTLHHYGLFRRIPLTYSSILQFQDSYKFMESEMKKASTADTTSLDTTSLASTPRLVTESTVQECGLARFDCCYVTVAFPTHYAVSSIDGSSQWDSLTFLLVARTTVQECKRARFARYFVTAALLSHYAVSSIDGSSQSQPSDVQTGVSKAFYLLSDVCSHKFRLNEHDDCVLRSPAGINCWARHGNVEFRGLYPTKPSPPSSIFILSTSLEVKLELEIHLVSSVSHVGFKAESSCFSAKSSHVGLRTLKVVYISRALHLKLWSVNNTRCINVVLDYQLFLGTIAMGSKVELPVGSLHFAELDSPLDGSILSCFVLFFSFFRLSSMAPDPDPSASVVIVLAP